MGFFSSIFGGSRNNNPGWMRDAGRDMFNRTGSMYDDYNPQIEVARGMENFDRMGAGARAARGVASRGFGGSVTPSMDLTRARFGAGLWTQANENEREWKRKMLMAQFGMLPDLQNLYGKHQEQGYGQMIGGMFA
jgi:hypothetical protein